MNKQKELYHGVMGVGKTALLIQHRNQLRGVGIKASIFTPNGGMVTSRNGKYQMARKATINNLITARCDYLLIDEYQFLEHDTLLYLIQQKTHHVRLYGITKWATIPTQNFITATNGDFKPYRLTMNCQWGQCTNEAEYNILFNKHGNIDRERMNPLTGQVNTASNPTKIPKSDFKAICYNCYLELTQKKGV